MLDFWFILLLIVFNISIIFVFSKNTFLEFNPRQGSIWIVLLLQTYLLILMPILLLNLYGVNNFSNVLYFVKDEGIFKISLISIYALFAFSLTVLFFARFIKLPIDFNSRLSSINSDNLKVFVNSSVVCSFLIFLFSYLFLGYKHAFIESILTGSNVLNVRLDNVYKSQLPSQLSYLIYLSYIISSIFSGIQLAQNKYIKFFIYLFISLFLASIGGQKAPVFSAITICLLSYVSVVGFKFSIKKTLFSIFIYIPLLYLFLFLIVSLQINELDFISFNHYLIGRLGVGQMAGTFETFSMNRLDGDFYLHIFPFASFFYDYIPYDKALMMYTEGYRFDEMGVKNSFFVSEAYGIGGWPLLIASPFIVGLSFILGLKIFYLFLKSFFGESVAIIYCLPIFILTTNLTGGFSSFPFFKGLIQIIILFFIIYLFYIFMIKFKLGK